MSNKMSYKNQRTFEEEDDLEAQLDVNSRKKRLRLDLKVNVEFNMRPPGVEKESSSPVILSSPDLQKLLLKTPELENLVLLQSGFANFSSTHNQVDGISSHREPLESSFGDIRENPFQQSADHLRMHESNEDGGNVTTTNYQRVNSFHPSASTCDSHSHFDVFPEDELQIEPNRVDALDLYLLNVENRQTIKLEQRRMKNRAAASKCRKRKLEKIAHLEEKAKLLRGENADLTAFMLDLKRQVCQLKNQILGHVNNGCRIEHYY